MLEIRVATGEDLTAIFKLYSQPGFDDQEMLDESRLRTIFERFKLYPDYRLFVALADNAVIGTFALLIMDNLGHNGAPSGIIEDVVVDPQRQGQGIGRQMMEFALQQCREAGCYKAMLSTNLKREAAHRFYETLGFEKHGYSYLLNFNEE